MTVIDRRSNPVDPLLAGSRVDYGTCPQIQRLSEEKDSKIQNEVNKINTYLKQILDRGIQQDQKPQVTKEDLEGLGASLRIYKKEDLEDLGASLRIYKRVCENHQVSPKLQEILLKTRRTFCSVLELLGVGK